MKRILACAKYEELPLRLVRGSGCRVFDERGKAYVDLVAGAWATVLGHSHARVNEVIARQAATLMHTGFTFGHAYPEEAAQRLLDVASLHDGKCVFLSSGSEAVELGVQIMRRLSKKPQLLGLADAFLGSYGSAGSQSAAEWTHFDCAPCATCPDAQTCRADCDRLAPIRWDEIGGFVLEPGNAGGMVRLPPRGVIRMLESRVRRHGGLVMVNEITTGIGRTGRWFGHHHYDTAPDIVAAGKGLGNGYPVSAVAMRGEVARELEHMGFKYTQSHQNDPLGCAVAKEVLDVVREEGLVERAAAIGARFKASLEDLQRRRPVVGAVRGRGLMIAVDLEVPVGPVFAALLERGYLAGCTPARNVLRFYPPLTIDERSLTGLVADLDDVLFDAADDSRSPTHG